MIKKKKVTEPSYKGMYGKLNKKQKAAVDEVEGVVRSTLYLDENHVVNVRGSYQECVSADTEVKGPVHVWTLLGVDYYLTRDGDPQNGTGVIWDAYNVQGGNVLTAALGVLTTHGTKPKNNKNGTVDVAADARRRLEVALRLPAPTTALRAIQYVLWSHKRNKDMPLSECLNGRPLGFYDDTLKAHMERLTSVPDFDAAEVSKAFTTARAEKPMSIYELVLKGYDHKDSSTKNLVKRVAARPGTFNAWATKELTDQLVTSPTDITSDSVIPDQANREKMQRTLLKVPREKGGVDLILSGTNDTFVCQVTNPVAPKGNPTEAWIKESQDYLTAKADAFKKKYENSSTYQRVEEELSLEERSKYKTAEITVTGDGKFYASFENGGESHDTLFDCMVSIDENAKKEGETRASTPVTPSAKPEPEEGNGEAAEKPKKKSKKKEKPGESGNSDTLDRSVETNRPVKEVDAEEAETQRMAETVQQVASDSEQRRLAESCDDANENVAEAGVDWPNEGPVDKFEILGRDDMPWERVQTYFKQAESDRDAVKYAIKTYLMTEYQKATLEELNVSLDDLLNGTYPEGAKAEVEKTFADWNARIGENVFFTPS